MGALAVMTARQFLGQARINGSVLNYRGVRAARGERPGGLARVARP